MAKESDKQAHLIKIDKWVAWNNEMLVLLEEERALYQKMYKSRSISKGEFEKLLEEVRGKKRILELESNIHAKKHYNNHFIRHAKNVKKL